MQSLNVYPGNPIRSLHNVIPSSRNLDLCLSSTESRDYGEGNKFTYYQAEQAIIEGERLNPSIIATCYLLGDLCFICFPFQTFYRKFHGFEIMGQR
jgi:hypothetical protein